MKPKTYKDVTAEIVLAGLRSGHNPYVVILGKRESTWNPTSTKQERAIFGPAVVTYTSYPSHIECHVEAL